MSDVMLNSMLKVKNGVGEEWLQGYGLLTIVTMWLTGSCGRPCPASRERIMPQAASPGKTNMQNLKYSFYWMRITFTP